MHLFTFRGNDEEQDVALFFCWALSFNMESHVPSIQENFLYFFIDECPPSIFSVLSFGDSYYFDVGSLSYSKNVL